MTKRSISLAITSLLILVLFFAFGSDDDGAGVRGVACSDLETADAVWASPRRGAGVLRWQALVAGSKGVRALHRAASDVDLEGPSDASQNLPSA